MSQYVLLLHSDPTGWAKMSPDEMQKAVEKFMAWSQKPFIKSGKRLRDDAGRIMRGANGQTRTTDGPYSESKEVVGGFFIVEADNYDEAVACCHDHPTLEYGGTIEIRQIWEM